jgi:hypothetical protein
LQKEQRTYYFLWQLYHLMNDERAAADELERAQEELGQLEQQHANHDAELQVSPVHVQVKEKGYVLSEYTE